MRDRALLLMLPLLLFCGAARAEKPRLAVMDLSAKSGIEQNQLDVLGDMLATEIRSIGKHEVITKADIQSMIGLERSKELLACDDASCMAEIGGALGVELMVSGNVGRFADVFAVNMKLINVKQAKVENSVFRKVEGGERALLDDFPLAVRVLLGEAAGVLPSAAAIGTPPPDPSEADQTAALASLGFSEDQLARIRSRGSKITLSAVVASRKLIEREFGTAELTELMVEYDLMGRKPIEIEQFVLYATVGLPLKHFGKFYERIDRTDLTEYYNLSTESGFLGAIKWVMLPVGLLAGFIGVSALVVGPGNDVVADDVDLSMGTSLTVIGSVLLAGSIALIIIDAVDIGDLPDQFFKAATKSQILQAVGKAEPDASTRATPRGPTLIAAPFVPPRGGAGLALGLRF